MPKANFYATLFLFLSSLPWLLKILGYNWSATGRCQSFDGQRHTDHTPVPFQVFSHDPLILYIENFVSPEEIDHLLQLRYMVLSLHCLQTTRALNVNDLELS